MTNRPPSARVGAVVVSFDSEDDLSTCLDTLTGAEDVARVIVVDNASSDGSREAVGSSSDNRIELLALETNTGFAGGCNRGFAALGETVDAVAFVNPDVGSRRTA
jgi:GT2 family glycosyltransferase